MIVFKLGCNSIRSATKSIFDLSMKTLNNSSIHKHSLMIDLFVKNYIQNGASAILYLVKSCNKRTSCQIFYQREYLKNETNKKNYRLKDISFQRDIFLKGTQILNMLRVIHADLKAFMHQKSGTLGKEINWFGDSEKKNSIFDVATG